MFKFPIAAPPFFQRLQSSNKIERCLKGCLYMTSLFFLYMTPNFMTSCMFFWQNLSNINIDLFQSSLIHPPKKDKGFKWSFVFVARPKHHLQDGSRLIMRFGRYIWPLINTLFLFLKLGFHLQTWDQTTEFLHRKSANSSCLSSKKNEQTPNISHLFLKKKTSNIPWVGTCSFWGG